MVVLTTILYTGCTGLQRADDPETAVREVTDTRIESFLREMVTDGHFTGVALVIQEGEVIHARGYGAATSDTANYVTTAFHVASMTKQFTAAAIMQLVEKGAVELGGSVNQYLPQKYKSPTWNAVTVHHLLSHSSGITDYAVSRDYYDVVNGFCLGGTVDGMVREAMEKDLEFMPGSKFSYTNLGYTLLGFIIENQTKTAYDKYIKDNILDPMDMTSSRIHVTGHVPVADEAGGFRWSEEKGVHVPDDVVSLPVTAPDGGLVTTLSDFVK